jgi:hypothetical protein
LIFEDSEDDWDPGYWGLTDEDVDSDEGEQSEHYRDGWGPIRPRRRPLRNSR